MSFLNLNNDKDKNNEEEIESIIELGTEKQSDSKNIPKNIQFLTIIGEIEGHNVSPPQKSYKI